MSLILDLHHHESLAVRSEPNIGEPQPNQNANFLTDRRSAATQPRLPAPIQPESSSMPADDRFGLDDYQRNLPARPSRPQDCPEQAIQGAQRRLGPFPLQHGYLLAKREDFDSHVSAALEKDAGGGNQGDEEWQHGLPVLT